MRCSPLWATSGSYAETASVRHRGSPSPSQVVSHGCGGLTGRPVLYVTLCLLDLGSLLAQIWDVSNAAMRREDYRGLWRLTVLTSCLSPLPLVLIKLLPPNFDKQQKLQQSKESSVVAGTIFLLTLFVSLAWGVVQALAVVFRTDI